MIATLLCVMGVVLVLRLFDPQHTSPATSLLVGRIVKAAVLVPLAVILAVAAMGL